MLRLSVTVVVGALLIVGMFWMLATPVYDDPTLNEQSEAKSQAQTPKNSLPIELSRDLSCDARMADVRSLIQASKSCVVTKDCALFSPGCPFGCVDAARRSQIPQIKSAYRDYAKKCGACVYMCPQPAFERWAVCKNSVCVVGEKSAKLSEKATPDPLGAPESQ